MSAWGDPRGTARTPRIAHERRVCCIAVACLRVGAQAPRKWWRHVAPTRSRSAASRMEGFAVTLAMVDAPLTSAVARWSWMACASAMFVGKKKPSALTTRFEVASRSVLCEDPRLASVDQLPLGFQDVGHEAGGEEERVLLGRGACMVTYHNVCRRRCRALPVPG